MLVRTSKTIWEKIQTKVLGKEVKSLFSFFTFATFWRWHLYVCGGGRTCFYAKIKKYPKGFLFIVFSSISKNWILKITLFFSTTTSNDQHLEYSKFSHDDFLFEFSNNCCCFELFVPRIFYISEFFKQKSYLMRAAIMQYFWFCKEEERLEKLNPLAILHTVSHK